MIRVHRSRIYFILVYVFLYFPIIWLAIQSFNSSMYSNKWGGFTWQWYSVVLHSKEWAVVATRSAVVAICSATLSTIIGGIVAISFYLYKFYGKSILNIAIFILIMLPDIVIGIAFLVLYRCFNISLGFWTLLLAHIAFCIPFVIVILYSRLKNFDIRLIAAARDLGAQDAMLVYRVILPYLRGALLAGWLLSFTLSLDDVIVSYFVTGPEYETLPLRIFSLVRLGVRPEINALCTIILTLTLGLFLLASVLNKEK